jgi:phage baseplate assembly protein W
MDTNEAIRRLHEVINRAVTAATQMQAAAAEIRRWESRMVQSQGLPSAATAFEGNIHELLKSAAEARATIRIIQGDAAVGAA